MSRSYNILCIDGGGTRGVIPARILQNIWKDTGKQPKDLFYLMAGTSTGGILCTGYAYGIPPDTMLDLYLNKARKIFKDSIFDDFRDFGKLRGADYSNKGLEKELKEIFGSDTLHSVYDKNMASDMGRLMVCTFDLNPKKTHPETGAKKSINYRPKLYHSEFKRDQDESLVDICLRTSAGPTYFPIYEQFIDGGVTMNNPSMAALAYAINKNEDRKKEYRHPDGVKKGLGLDTKDIKMLSLGCGTSNRNFIDIKNIKENKDGDWGSIQWLKYLPDMLTETNVQASEYYAEQVLTDKNYLRVQLYFDNENAPNIIKDQVNKGKVLGLDVKDPKTLQSMVDYADIIYEKRKEEIGNLLEL